MRCRIALTALLALAACGKADDQPGPGEVTVSEAKALDEAAEMLEDRRPASVEAAASAASADPAETGASSAP